MVVLCTTALLLYPGGCHAENHELYRRRMGRTAVDGILRGGQPGHGRAANAHAIVRQQRGGRGRPGCLRGPAGLAPDAGPGAHSIPVQTQSAAGSKPGRDRAHDHAGMRQDTRRSHG